MVTCYSDDEEMINILVDYGCDVQDYNAAREVLSLGHYKAMKGLVINKCTVFSDCVQNVIDSPIW